MFSVDDLHFVRAHELEALLRFLPAPGSSLLELGAGTGYQALALSQRGFSVTAVDVPRSDYQRERVFPILDYDGIRLPLESESVDAVFSSNVLEHVVHLPEVLAETRRVLRPGGFAVHVMPSPSWRLWTSVSGPLDAAPYAAFWLMEWLRRRPLPARSLAGGIAARFAPTAHGERGTAFSELLTFSIRHWKQVFVTNGFEVTAAQPMRLFYTGWSLLGKRLSLATRERLASHLGSSCWIYKVRPI